MDTETSSRSTRVPAIASGPAFSAEPGLGSLTLPGFLRDVTRMYGEREALVMHTADGVTRWSYAQLCERAVEVARALRGCGVGKDGRVGVLMTNRPEWVAAVFGVALVGGVAVPLSTFSTPSELDHLLRISCVSVLLAERTVLNKDFGAILTELEPEIGATESGSLCSTKYPFLGHVALIGEEVSGMDTWGAFLDRGVDEPRDVVEATAETTVPSEAAVIFFSSGSTSKPKGIVSAHRGVTTQMWRFRRMYGFDREDDVRCWTANGFFWSGNFCMALGATLASGGSIVLQRTFEAAQALELMHAERVNFPVAWPHQWAELEGASNWDRVDLSSMRFVDVESSIASHHTVSTRWSEPGQAYGNTETFTISTGYPANTPPEVHGGSRGEPLPGVTVKIVDPETADAVARHERGEICVKGPTLMLGYLGIPLDETLDTEGFLHTGDGGYLDHADRVFWEGRITDIIKTGGANVSPREVDEALVGNPGVKLSQTVGVPHETLGEIVVACVVPHEGVRLEVDDLRTFLRERLASYKVPRHVLFFGEDEITLTGSAKIKAGDVARMAAQRLGG